MAKVILTNEVSGLGSAGDVIEVRNGYARNFLVPQGLAVGWTRGGEKQVEQIKQAREARVMQSAEDAQALKASLENALVKINVKAGKEGRLFGSVRPSAVAEAAEEQGIGRIDARKIEFPTPIKSVGNHEATVRLHDDIVATFTVQVVAAR